MAPFALSFDRLVAAIAGSSLDRLVVRSSCCRDGPRMGVDEGEGVNPSACGSPMLSERVLFKGQSVRAVVRDDRGGNRKVSRWSFLPRYICLQQLCGLSFDRLVADDRLVVAIVAAKFSCCRNFPGPRMAVDEGERVNPSACGSPMVSERVLFKGQSVRVVVRVDMAGDRKASWWWFFLTKSVKMN